MMPNPTAEFTVLPHEMKVVARVEQERDQKLAKRPPTGGYFTADVVDLELADPQPGGPVIANRRSKRYYLPKDRGYARAGGAKSVRRFPTEAAAKAAGFRHQ